MRASRTAADVRFSSYVPAGRFSCARAKRRNRTLIDDLVVHTIRAISGSGGGIYNDGGQFGNSFVEISNTILNAGALGANIFNSGGTVTSQGIQS